MIIQNGLRCRFVKFHFIVHFLNERPLFFRFRFKGINFFLLFLNCPVLFKKLVQLRFDLETVALIRLTANEERLRHGTLFQIAAKSTGKNYHPSVP